MRVTIAAASFDLSGYLEFEALPDSDFGALERRVRKTPTLDGDVVLDDHGFTHGDREMTLVYRPISEAHDAIARRLIELHPTVHVTTDEGVFEASPGPFEPTTTENRFVVSLKRKLSE